ncbi:MULTISPECIES: LysR family transcriptional regulator [Delftia]|uniref:LysR family transcriptional regulator n=2 Tax=Delftia TaxID=80865 RepID=A0A7T2RYX2_DELAC|nr:MULTISPECIES: LysR family transcriptional regulator [Delftia]MBB1652817.1 LysR family transcriptional regulator [Delftia sp. UME58]MBL8354861.1 LysR family transcriptional regulator [Delftia acidovorans]QPS05789.1 LysR family transcriptional regulator [Delftia acidovorans]
MSIDLRNLQCFLAVCAAGSISKAAQTVYIAQPAMSMHIKGLEEDLGLQLFERSAQGVKPTEAGLRLEQHARALLAQLAHALDDVRRMETVPGGPLNVGLPQSMAKLLTVPLVKGTLARWPQVRLQVTELSTGYIPQQLLQGQIDIGITFQKHGSSGVVYELLAEETLVLIAPPGQLAAKGKKLSQVRLASLAHYPLILPAPEHGLRILLDKLSSVHRLQWVPVAQVNAIHQIIDLVADGVGCSLLSYASVFQEIRSGKLSAAEITDPAISRPVYIARRCTDGPSMAQSSVCNLLRAITAELIGDGRWPARLMKEG